MGTRKRTNAFSSDSTGCGTCGEPRPREPSVGGRPGKLLWPLNRPFVHCTGSTVAWLGFDPPEIPHHGHVLYPPCWSCHGEMGCDQCAGVPAEVLCKRCAVWLLPIGLATHGPITNTEVSLHRRSGNLAPPVSSYPDRHQRLYHATEGRP